MTAIVLNPKINEVENKIHDHAKYTTSQEFNKLTKEQFTANLKQVNLVKRPDFGNNIISFNRKIT